MACPLKTAFKGLYHKYNVHQYLIESKIKGIYITGKKLYFLSELSEW